MGNCINPTSSTRRYQASATSSPAHSSPARTSLSHASSSDGLSSRGGNSPAYAPPPRVSLGTHPAHLRYGGNHPLESHQIQQAAYHLAAYAVGDEVTSPRRLAAAGQTVHDVRALLRHGRGNVQADTAPSGGHNQIGSSVAKMAADATSKIATAVAMGAAACDQTAPLVGIVHAPHMAPDERSETVSGTVHVHEITAEGYAVPARTGHTWNELRRQSDGRDGKSTVVMEAWGNGPAVRLKDSAWNETPVGDRIWAFDKDHAERMKSRLEGLVPLVHPDNDSLTEANVNKRLRDPVEWEQFAEPQVVSGEFADRTRAALSNMHPWEQREAASRVIQDTYGMEPGTYEHQYAVESVVATAHHLDALPRSAPVVPREG